MLNAKELLNIIDNYNPTIHTHQEVIKYLDDIAWQSAALNNPADLKELEYLKNQLDAGQIDYGQYQRRRSQISHKNILALRGL